MSSPLLTRELPTCETTKLSIADSVRRNITQWRYPESAADLRHRQIALAALTSGISRVSGLLLAYVCVTVAVGKLGAAAFGLWMAINAMSVILPFADFGLGNGLVSFVSRQIGESHLDRIRGAVSACLYIAAASGAVIAIGGVLLSHSPLLLLLLRIRDSRSTIDISVAVTTFFLCFGLTLPLSITEKVQMGAQDAWIANVWQLLANVSTCIALYAVTRAQCSLSSLILVYSGIPLLFKALNLALYSSLKPRFAPEWIRPDWNAGRSLLKCGASFVILQSFVAIGYACDNLILASQSGPVAVAEYDVVQRLFSLTVVTELSIAPLWGAFGEALARGDVKWVRRTFQRSLLGNGLLVIAICVPLLAFGRHVVDLWTKSAIHPSLLLLAAFGLWRLLSVLQGNLSVLLNHEQTLRQQTAWFVCAAVFAFGLKFLLLRAVGSPGVIFATVIAFSALYALPGLKMARALFHSISGEEVHQEPVCA